MRVPPLVVRPVRILALLGLAGTAAGIAPAAAATAAPRPATFHSPASFTISGNLRGVAAVSSRSAWGVGSTGGPLSSRTLVLHWNSTAWRRVPSPSSGGFSALYGVAAVSAGSTWAVGCTDCSTNRSGRTLVLHWDGAAWKRVPSPSPGGYSVLTGVGALSAGSAWAVGYTYANGAFKTLVLRWNGTD